MELLYFILGIYLREDLISIKNCINFNQIEPVVIFKIIFCRVFTIHYIVFAPFAYFGLDSSLLKFYNAIRFHGIITE